MQVRGKGVKVHMIEVIVVVLAKLRDVVVVVLVVAASLPGAR